MHGTIPPLLLYTVMAWSSAKAHGLLPLHEHEFRYELQTYPTVSCVRDILEAESIEEGCQKLMANM
jgi:hypothetical protein